MKPLLSHIAILWLMLFGIYACQNPLDELSVRTDKDLMERNNPYYVSYDDALAKAEAFLNRESPSTRALQREVSDYYTYIPYKQTRNVGDSIDVCFHIFNFADNNGFAVVSADSRTTSIYAYSDVGHLDIADTTQNTGISLFFENAIPYYKSEIMNAPITDAIPKPQPEDSIGTLAAIEKDGKYYHAKYEYTTLSSVPALLPVTWAQWSPYNYYCKEISNADEGYDDKAAAGCGPVAAAQIMSYFRYPSSVGANTFDWDAIMQSTSYPLQYYTTSSLATAFLIKKTGDYSNADYGKETPTKRFNLFVMFQQFGYSISSSDNFDEAKIRSSLAANSLVFMMGKSNVFGGHAWVIDGYSYEQLEITYYELEEPYEIYDKEQRLRMYCHCNWGWGGKDNGYFLNTFRMEFKDQTAYWNNNMKMFYNIKPN